MSVMKNVLMIVVLLMTGVVTMAPATAVDPLTKLAGKSRVVILFAKSRSSAVLDSQVDRLRERRIELAERDMIVLVNEGEQNTVVAIGYTDLPKGTSRLLDRRFTPETNKLTTVLIGKDGLEKGRWQGVTDPQSLFDLVDAMQSQHTETGQQSATN